MKKVVVLALLLLITKVNLAQINASLTELDKIIEAEKQSNAWKLKDKSNPLTNNYDLKYHRLEWYIDPIVDSVKGCISSYFVVLSNNFNQINFDCSNDLVIDSVVYHGITVLFSQQPNNLLQINLPSIISINSLDSVSVYYEGTPYATGFGSFVQTTHAGSPIIWTLSEPYGAQDWWPCKNGLVDKIDSIDVIVTTPQINRAASNGVLVEEIQSGTNKIYHWKHRHPIATYLIAIAVTNYVYYSNYVPFGNDSFEVLNYVYPEADSLAKTQTPDIVNVIKLYDSLLGVIYPFADEKYGHAQFGWGGGMEHQTMSFVTG